MVLSKYNTTISKVKRNFDGNSVMRFTRGLVTLSNVNLPYDGSQVSRFKDNEVDNFVAWFHLPRSSFGLLAQIGTL